MPRRLGPAGCHTGAERVKEAVGEGDGGGRARLALALVEQRSAAVEARGVLLEDARVPYRRGRRDRPRVVEEEGDLAPASAVVDDVVAAFEPVRKAGEEAQRDVVDVSVRERGPPMDCSGTCPAHSEAVWSRLNQLNNEPN